MRTHLNKDGQTISALESAEWSTPTMPVSLKHSARDCRLIFEHMLPHNSAGFFRVKGKTPNSKGRWDPTAFLQEPVDGYDESTGERSLFPYSTNPYIAYRYAVNPSPGSRLLILDLDQPKSPKDKQKCGTPEQMRDRLSSILGVDLSQTMTVITPSGGLHLYLKLPKRFQPSARAQESASSEKKFITGTIGKYNSYFRQVTGVNPHLKGDIRSGYSKGYVVGPTNLYEHERPEVNDMRPDGSYLLHKRVPPMLLPVKACNILKEVAAAHHNRQRTQQVRKERAQKADARRKRIRENLSRQPSLKARKARSAFGVKNTGRDVTLQGYLSEMKRNGVARDYRNIKKDPETDRLLRLIPDEQTLGLLVRQLTKRDSVPDADMSYHARRAFLTRCMWCCHSKETIAGTCIYLMLDRDSHRDTRIPVRELVKDITRIMRSRQESTVFHGIACPNKPKYHSINTKMQDDKDLMMERLAAKVERIKAGEGGRYLAKGEPRRVSPKVVDMVKVSKALESPRAGMVTQQYKDAMGIMDAIAQPLCNVGDRVFPMSYDYIKKVLGITGTNTRARQALRVLREQGVLVMTRVPRKGTVGMYMVHDDFISLPLTRALRSLWMSQPTDENGDREPIFFDRQSCEFREVFYGRVVVGNFLYGKHTQSIVESESLKWADPRFVGPGAALRYLKEERTARGMALADDGETLFYMETGEIVEYAPRVSTRHSAPGVLRTDSPQFMGEAIALWETVRNQGKPVNTYLDGEIWEEVVAGMFNRNIDDTQGSMAERCESMVRGLVPRSRFSPEDYDRYSRYLKKTQVVDEVRGLRGKYDTLTEYEEMAPFDDLDQERYVNDNGEYDGPVPKTGWCGHNTLLDMILTDFYVEEHNPDLIPVW